MNALIVAGIYLLETMFVVGLVGSFFVAVITFVEDVQRLVAAFGED
jgi:hypothetical protein